MWLVHLVALFVCVQSVVSQTCSILTTFNVGLTPHVENYQNRKSAIPDALLNEDPDVYCLQEYWQEADMQEMLDKVESVYPYHYSAIHHQVGQVRLLPSWWQAICEHPDTACSDGDITYFKLFLLPCAIGHSCLAAFANSHPAGMECLAKNCPNLLKAKQLDADCISCLILTVSSLEDVFTRCSNPNDTSQHNRLNAPGLVLLSKKPISNARYQSFFPGAKMAIQRGYLEADVTDVGKVYCTHLSSKMPYYLEYDLDYGSYSAQQKEEIVRARAAFGDTNHVFTGDINTGPEISDSDPEKNLDAEVPENYALLLSYGYQNFYMEQDGRCTWCIANAIVPEYNEVIDYVLTMGDEFSSVTTTRVLDQTSPLSLSDHYGVKATLCKA